MAESKKKPASAATAEKEPRAVAYVAFAELRPGWWALIADTESSSVYTLRKELRAQIAQAQLDAGLAESSTHNLVIVPKEHAHFVEIAQQMRVEETFKKVQPEPSDLASMIGGPAPVETEADIAARMGSESAPLGAVLGPEQPEVVAEPYIPAEVAAADVQDAQAAAVAADTAAQAALNAEAAARAAAVPPADPDDDEAEFTGNPDVDPLTGVSRRSAAESTPEDEGMTIFPPDEREP
jgi:hypothetical protein